MRHWFVLVLLSFAFALKSNTLPLVYDFTIKGERTKESVSRRIIDDINRSFSVRTVPYKQNGTYALHLSSSYYNLPRETTIISFDGLDIYFNWATRVNNQREYHMQFKAIDEDTEDTGRLVVKISNDNLTIQPFGSLSTRSFYNFIDKIERIIINVGSSQGVLNAYQFRRITQ
ncbi:hypothetical protein NEFER03_2050 [Nematocida sp. LUAm3]|nr:hypothetical protein NEFER03_0026 [Nematocida sp. LUAm3]KAI5175737.1 hypothetical protein NEFER02_1624 [Nematocida sp. LUAm2]KAI5176700.1 hypothetical protein NEFER01_0025 [Nematocida sp. LUAm1]KAI5171804.1 hypothetical protein NEFER03_1109 [Nematocida sp. LUAm3]KAI5172691.1 hypothetical protein NEFER03_1747 [Nematocida sp. LUAm3]